MTCCEPISERAEHVRFKANAKLVSNSSRDVSNSDSLFDAVTKSVWFVQYPKETFDPVTTNTETCRNAFPCWQQQETENLPQQRRRLG